MADRITFKRIVDEVNFCPRLIFLKDDKEFARLSMELIQDLTFKSPPDSPFKGPEFTVDEAYAEILNALKYELNDETLEEELERVLTELKNSNLNAK